VIECRALAPSEYPAWDAFVESSDNGTIFHTSRWLAAVAGEFTIHACFAGAKLVAGMPVARHRRDGVRTVFQPPLTPYLGIVWSPQSNKNVARRSLAKEVALALAAAVLRGHDSVTINFSPEWDDLHGFMWAGFSTAVRYTYMLPLADLKAVWEEMDGRRRNDIRRAEKEGVIVRQTDDHEAVLRLVGTTFTRQGMTPGFFNAARKIHAVAETAQFFAYQPGDDTPVAAVYLVWDRRRAYYLLGGYDEKRAHGGAHALAMWRAIEFAAHRGVQQFDFEGSQIPQVEKYFRKFGGKLTPYYRASWTSPRARLIGDAMRVARRVLRPFRKS
jgi:hypothetical protein